MGMILPWRELRNKRKGAVPWWNRAGIGFKLLPDRLQPIRDGLRTRSGFREPLQLRCREILPVPKCPISGALA